MSQKKTEEPKIVQPMIDELRKTQKPRDSPADPIGERPLQPSELDQDSGGGYNPDGTYPQD